MRKCFIGVLALLLAVTASAEENVRCVSVKTKATNNAEAKFWYHVPEGYDAKRKTPYPVLVYFGGRNCTGEAEASGKLGWSDWADANGVFLIAPGFLDDFYWEPEKWSGPALFDVLRELKKSYRIDDAKLCYYGYSAGSQAANLFPAWRPSRCRGWVSHACGVFHEPTVKMRGVPGLVTCGDADSARYVISRDFVAKARKRGVDVIFKTFPNHEHDVPPDSLRLAKAFLAYCIKGHEPGAKSFVGDDVDNLYYPAESVEAEFVDPSERVVLPTVAIAEAWGRPGERSVEVKPPAKEERIRLKAKGVEFLCRIPRQYDRDSRIVVLFGGRGWNATKTLDTFAFGELADHERAFLVSPSFSKGEYWNPDSGTGDLVSAVVSTIEKRYGLREQGVILYGYSAGGQCSALFSQFDGLDVSAWGVHGCGVFPDEFDVRAQAFVTCGEKDAERMTIGRNFAARYREKGGSLLLKPLPGGHELDERALSLAREWIRAMLAGGESWIWGEDGTYKVKDKDLIDPDVRNPLYTRRLVELWRE